MTNTAENPIPPADASEDLDGIIRGLQAPLLRYAYRLLGNGVDAENALQDTVITFLAKRKGLFDKSPSGLRCWLYGTLRYKCLQTPRDPRVVATGEAAAERQVNWTPEDEASSNEELAVCHAAMAAMGPLDREVIVLKCELELSTRDIAEIMGLVTEEAVRSRLKRARDRLREEIRSRSPYLAELISRPRPKKAE